MKVLTEALDAGGGALTRHYGKLESFDEKSSIDLVTVADRESEAAIIKVISSHCPDHRILAEESGTGHGGNSGEYRWIVDPLDGTTNFAHSMPVFSVSVALMKGNEAVVAGVENPVTGERFLAERGSGSTLNAKKIAVSRVASLDRALLVTGFPYDRKEHADRYLAILRAFLLRGHGVLRLGSAALDLCSVAAGRLDAFWEEKLHPWDTAAGWLIVEEAGGRVTDFRGSSYQPECRSILASNRAIHDECLEVLTPYR